MSAPVRRFLRKLSGVVLRRYELYRFVVDVYREGGIENRFYVVSVTCPVRVDLEPGDVEDEAREIAREAVNADETFEDVVESVELVGPGRKGGCTVEKISESYDVYDYVFYFKYDKKTRPSQNRNFEVRVTFWINRGDDPNKYWDEAETIAYTYIELFGITDLTGWSVDSEKSRGAEFRGTDTRKVDYDVEINDLYRANQGPWSRSEIESFASARYMAAGYGYP